MLKGTVPAIAKREPEERRPGVERNRQSNQRHRRNRAFLDALAAGATVKARQMQLSTRSAAILHSASQMLYGLHELLLSFETARPDESIAAACTELLAQATAHIDEALGYSDERWEQWLRRLRTVKTDDEWREEFRVRGAGPYYTEAWLDPAVLDEQEAENVAS
jgi:hypothetical protein